MRRFFVALLMVSALSGCATGTLVPYQIDSTPPGAKIEVDGVSFGATPTRIELQCNKRWVGLAYAPDGWAYDGSGYQVTAFPTKASPGVAQTKRINACQIKTPPGRLHFDLGLDAQTPRQRVDINFNQSGQADKPGTLDETIRALKRLRDQKLLSESEYQQKVDKAVKDAQ